MRLDGPLAPLNERALSRSEMERALFFFSDDPRCNDRYTYGVSLGGEGAWFVTTRAREHSFTYPMPSPPSRACVCHVLSPEYAPVRPYKGPPCPRYSEGYPSIPPAIIIDFSLKNISDL